MILVDLSKDPDAQVKWHALFELGIDPNDQGSPIKAAVSSFCGFAVGAFIPLLPWIFISENRRLAFVLTMVLSLGTCLLLGYCLGWILGLSCRKRMLSGLRQCACTLFATGCVI